MHSCLVMENGFSGVLIDLTSFRGDIIYSIGVTAFMHTIIGHWTWSPDEFLALILFIYPDNSN